MGPPQPQLTLYNNESSIYGRRVTMALAETNLRHKTFSIPFTGSKPDWFLSSINPKGTLPALTYGGPPTAPDSPAPESAKIAESHIILEFLADLCPDARLMPPPGAAVQRARVRAFADTVDTLFAPACRGWIVEGQSYVTVLNGARAVQRLLPPLPLSSSTSTSMSNLKLTSTSNTNGNTNGNTPDPTTAAADQGPYAIGAQFTIADLSVAPFLACIEVASERGIGNYAPEEARALAAAMNAPEFARLKAYARCLARRASYQAAIDKAAGEAVEWGGVEWMAC
ncbi:hypothetical protein CONPUDRAFT_142947 [Coniophora puteana RWD-64-598 SS2]|uniref:GST N-terminal domain-containing protein n=1 Tax=Coniophora puteana (strain RWD-64-598) TaxID=741705 RepID=A0A5M3MUX2_CONPW|nr:uncharacterized protein CONPUDRAFT_142947 [Coniophora puteana RWD-64-598 SS2]EIW82797.1 hypothetical protein CONPUDRAFT_142947 [Coniophora puteana RWD-64-598 SS2]